MKRCPLVGRWPAVLAVLLLVAAAGCNSLQNAEVNSSFGPGMKSNPGQTFDWSPAAQATMKDMEREYPHVHTLILKVVDAELTRKGYTHVTTGTADIWLAYDMGRRRTADPYTGDPYNEALFGLNLIDPASGKIMFRGSARPRVDPQASPEEREKRLTVLIREMLKLFPDRGKPAQQK